MKGSRKRIDPEAVREMAGRGMTDREIARELGHHRPNITTCRTRHGIPAGQPGPRATDPIPLLPLFAEGLTDWQIAERTGVGTQSVRKIRLRYCFSRISRTESFIRRLREKSCASQFGLPDWVTGTQVKILLALAKGPLIVPQIVDLIGCSVNGRRKGSRYTLVRELREAGLVAAYYAGANRSRVRIYMLTIPAMNMMIDMGDQL